MRYARTGALTLFAFLLLICAKLPHAASLEPQATPAAVDFRASGYDPLWLFEVDRQGEVRFSVDGGKAVIRMAATGLNLKASSTGVVYGAITETQQFLADILETSCLDTVGTGARLTHTVTIRLDGREYRGCGRRIQAGDIAD